MTPQHPHDLGSKALAAIAVVSLLWGLGACSPSGPAAEPGRPSAVAGPGPDSPTPSGRQTSKKAGSEVARVTRIIDGDTVELDNGRSVRLLGLDTPERGECGYQRAANRLAALVEGKPVRLVSGPTDQDRYGRLLRYLDQGRTDAGLALIKAGVAIARYDSRDGYGPHPREKRYIRADLGAQGRCRASGAG